MTSPKTETKMLPQEDWYPVRPSIIDPDMAPNTVQNTWEAPPGGKVEINKPIPSSANIFSQKAYGRISQMNPPQSNDDYSFFQEYRSTIIVILIIFCILLLLIYIYFSYKHSSKNRAVYNTGQKNVKEFSSEFTTLKDSSRNLSEEGNISSSHVRNSYSTAPNLDLDELYKMRELRKRVRIQSEDQIRPTSVNPINSENASSLPTTKEALTVTFKVDEKDISSNTISKEHLTGSIPEPEILSNTQSVEIPKASVNHDQNEKYIDSNPLHLSVQEPESQISDSEINAFIHAITE